MENATLAVTQSLPAQPKTKQESLAIQAGEDQEDVKKLFFVLVESLADVRDWGGPVGAGANDGLRILKAARVGLELDTAGDNMRKADFPSAATSQQAVIRGLRALLDKLEETQGLIGADREAALEMVRELMKRQEAVRHQTRQADLAEPEAEKLVESQAAIQKDIGKLAERLQQMPQSLPLAEQAKSAAYEATARLFDAKSQEAQTEQGKVLGSLAQIEEQLLNDVDLDATDKTADELAQLVKDLEETRRELKDAKAMHKEVVAAKTQPEMASKQEAAVAEKVKKAAEKQLPAAVESRLATAQDAAEDAAEALKKGEEAAMEAEEKLASTSEALDAAAAEVEAALADAKRRELAVKVGELARAAETLERAAAAERRDRRTKPQRPRRKRACQRNRLRPWPASRPMSKQIAQKVAEGVKNTAPESATKVAEADRADAAAAEQVKAAEEEPGEASKPVARQIAQQAAKAAEKLTQAAAKLRADTESGGTASWPKSAASNWIACCRPAKPSRRRWPRRRRLWPSGWRSWRKLKAKWRKLLPCSSAPPADPMPPRRWTSGVRSPRPWRSKQQGRSGGRSVGSRQGQDAVRCGHLAGRSQRAGGQAPPRRPPIDPQAAKAKAEARPDDLTQSLQKAQEAAARAAQKTLDGNATQAGPRATKLAKPWQQLRRWPRRKPKQAAQTPAGKPSVQAQQQVGQMAGDARQMSAADAPEAAESLTEAGKQSAQAQQQAQAGQRSEAGKAQQVDGRSHSRRRASRSARRRRHWPSRKGHSWPSRPARPPSSPAKTAEVDSGATTALQQAQRAAQTGCEASPADAAASRPRPPSKCERSMERAAASLASREQRIRRDQAIAEALAKLAGEQQQAAAEIQEQRGDAGKAGRCRIARSGQAG